MTIRPATAADLPAVRRITDAAFAPYIERIGMRPVPMDADHAALIDADAVWIADEDGATAGFCVLLLEPDHLMLDTVAVDPSWRGRGVGRGLIRFAEQHAAAHGRPEVRLYTHQLMTENRALYPRLGYRETGGPDAGIPRVHFVKPVPGSGADPAPTPAGR